MADLVPSSFWNFPSFRIPSLWEDEEDWVRNTAGGVSVSEDEKNIYVEASLPGLNPEDIEVTYEKGFIWIKGEAKREEDNKKYYKRALNSFSYRVAVPGEIDQNIEPEATYKNGVMTVKFAKSPKSQPRKITVKTE